MIRIFDLCIRMIIWYFIVGSGSVFFATLDPDLLEKDAILTPGYGHLSLNQLYVVTMFCILSTLYGLLLHSMGLSIKIARFSMSYVVHSINFVWLWCRSMVHDRRNRESRVLWRPSG